MENRKEKPEELVKLAEKLRSEWCDNNIISVGTGYGFSSDSISVDGEVKGGIYMSGQKILKLLKKNFHMKWKDIQSYLEEK